MKASINRTFQMRLAAAASEMNIGFIKWHLSRISEECAPNSSWARESHKLYTWLCDTSKNAPFTIFAKGNSKLPFFSFSVLPIVTCPGAGACATYCYSLKAWRYPSAFFRQLQNTILVKTQSMQLAQAFYALPKNTDVRLYVDGDFDSVETVNYWFELIKNRPDLRVYGYSKSWNELLQYKGVYPANYKLNLSSGHAHTDAIKHKITQLLITRGDFTALPVKQENIGKYKTKGYLEDLRTSAKSAGIDKFFACPGKCGTCTKQGHACGSDKFSDVPILIGIH